MTWYAVYRSDCTLAENPISFVHYGFQAFLRKDSQDKDLVRLLEICSLLHKECQFVIVPVTRFSDSVKEPQHWDEDGWWNHHVVNNNYPSSMLI